MKKIANSRDTYKLLFIETFTIAEQSDQSHYPSIDERINKILTIEYNSATKKKKIMYLAGRYIELEIILTEIS